jgi:bifunctional DNA-binding transcriptional regulator/antitoxin component of YhaV-PrlF toxin-antitoxin module
MKRTATKTAFSRVSVKSQTVLPGVVREMLRVKPGDRLRYRLTGEGVLIDKAPSADDDPFAAFSEWAGDSDERAYAKL